MTTIVISGVTLTLTATTAATLRREIAEDRAERKLHETLRAMKPGDPNYSDIYKEVYDVRPRW